MKFFQKREKKFNIFALSEQESQRMFRIYANLIWYLGEIPQEKPILQYYPLSFLPADKMTMKCILKKDFERQYPHTSQMEVHYMVALGHLAYSVDDRLYEAIKSDRQLNGDTTLNFPETAVAEQMEMNMNKVFHEVAAEHIALDEEWNEFVNIIKNAKEGNGKLIK